MTFRACLPLADDPAPALVKLVTRRTRGASADGGRAVRPGHITRRWRSAEVLRVRA